MIKIYSWILGSVLAISSISWYHGWKAQKYDDSAGVLEFSIFIIGWAAVTGGIIFVHYLWNKGKR